MSLGCVPARSAGRGAMRACGVVLACAAGLAGCGGGGDPAASDRAAAQDAPRTQDGAAAQPQAGADATVAGTLSAPHPTLQNLSLVWNFSGDANGNGRVAVKYRVQGETAWKSAMALRRVAAGSTGGWAWTARHAGSVFDLKPGTTYEVQLTLTDPDGGGATRTLTATTRKVPVPMADAPVKRATPSTLAGLIAGAQPGDIIELAAGRYGSIDWTADGSAGRPVVLRQAAGGGAVIDGEIYMYQRRHVMLDGLVVNGRIRFNASDFVSITRCTVNARADVGDGIGIVAYLQSEDAYIADNVVTGTTTWSAGALGDGGDNLGDGILVGGPGHVIMNNRVSGFRDDISLLDAGEAANQYSIDILNNDLSVAGDDAIEADFCAHNCRVMRNRITNAYTGVSSQPSLGGPTWFVRNVMYNVAYVAFKLYGTSIGNMLVHNTVVKNGDALGIFAGAPVKSLYSRNNLLIGGPGGIWGGYSSGSGRTLEIWDLETATADMNRDLFGSTLGSFTGHWGHTAYSGLGQLQSISTEKSAGQTALAVFARPPSFPAAVLTTFAPPDLRPASGGAAIDAGVPLANLNTGYAGAAPDAGAYEAGKALPVYGPR